MIWITEKLSFLYQKKNLVKLKQKTTFALMFFLMKINHPFQSTFKKFENSNQWKQITLCVHQKFWQIHLSQNKKLKKKKLLQKFFYSALVLKMFWKINLPKH